MELPTPQDLRERRTTLELTQSDLADAADVSQPLIARIEGGDVDPRLSTLRRRIVNALQEAEGKVVRASDLMNETVISVAPDDAVHGAVELMEEEAYSQLPVLQNGVPVDQSERRGPPPAAKRGRPSGQRCDERESFPTVARAGATVDEVRNLLDHYKAVMVTDGGETVGIITEGRHRCAPVVRGLGASRGVRGGRTRCNREVSLFSPLREPFPNLRTAGAVLDVVEVARTVVGVGVRLSLRVHVVPRRSASTPSRSSSVAWGSACSVIVPPGCRRRAQAPRPRTRAVGTRRRRPRRRVDRRWSREPNRSSRRGRGTRAISTGTQIEPPLSDTGFHVR